MNKNRAIKLSNRKWFVFKWNTKKRTHVLQKVNLNIYIYVNIYLGVDINIYNPSEMANADYTTNWLFEITAPIILGYSAIALGLVGVTPLIRGFFLI